MKRWLLIRDRALVLNAGGIPYGDAFQMAIREIPEGDGIAGQAATVANDADAANRQTIIARKEAGRANILKAADELKAAFPGADYTWRYNQACAAHPEFVNDMNLAVPPPLEKTADRMQYSDGRGHPAPGSSTTLPYPPWLRLAGAAATNTTNAQSVPWADIERLQLPVDCSPEEWQAAKGCGSADAQKLFDCLCEWTAETRNISLVAASCYCLGRFQKISKTVRPVAVPMSGASLQINPPVQGQP